MTTPCTHCARPESDPVHATHAYEPHGYRDPMGKTGAALAALPEYAESEARILAGIYRAPFDAAQLAAEQLRARGGKAGQYARAVEALAFNIDVLAARQIAALVAVREATTAEMERESAGGEHG